MKLVKKSFSNTLNNVFVAEMNRNCSNVLFPQNCGIFSDEDCLNPLPPTGYKTFSLYYSSYHLFSNPKFYFHPNKTKCCFKSVDTIKQIKPYFSLLIFTFSDSEISKIFGLLIICLKEFLKN